MSLHLQFITTKRGTFTLQPPVPWGIPTQRLVHCDWYIIQAEGHSSDSVPFIHEGKTVKDVSGVAIGIASHLSRNAAVILASLPKATREALNMSN